MSVINSDSVRAGASGVTASYTIDNSCRFNDDDSAHMSNTFSTGSATKMTISFWIKRCGFGTEQFIFALKSSYEGLLQFQSDDTMRILDAGGSNLNFTTARKYRDPGAWMHHVIAIDMAHETDTDKCKWYQNGTRIPDSEFAVSNQAGSVLSRWPLAEEHVIGEKHNATSSYLDAYLAEFVFIDDAQSAVTDFGESDANGNWVPIDPSGLTFGTNGFYLDFAVAPGTGNGAGTDVSGEANHFADSGLAANDQVTDSPTDDADNDIGNYATFSSLDVKDTHTASDGNLKVISTSGTNGIAGNFGMTSGKWYFETTILVGYNARMGVRTLGSAFVGGGSTSADFWVLVPSNGNTEHSSSDSYGSGSSVGNTLMCAIDMDNKKIWWGNGGTWYASGDPAAGTNAAYTDLPTAGVQVYQNTGSGGHGHLYNFGQLGFAHTPPVGFKAMHTGNIPAPTITDPSKFFQVDTFTGTGSELVRTLTDGAGGAVKPDFVWIKDRDTSVEYVATDSARGATKELNCDANSAESTVAQGLKSFDTSGYTLGTDGNYNTSSSPNVAWCWNTQGGAGASNEDGSINTTTTSVNTTAGFSISTYTGTGSVATVGHGLGAAPDLIIIKDRGNASGWPVYHSANTAAPATDYLELNQNYATTDNIAHWNDTAPTSSVFTLGTHGDVNGSSNTYVAYCWAGVEGYSRFGTYEGNGAADGTFVWLGFRPAFILLKNIDVLSDWVLLDNKRAGYNVKNYILAPSEPQGETTSDVVDFVSNGLKFRSSGGSVNTAVTYVYAAFAAFPFGGDGVSQARAR